MGPRPRSPRRCEAASRRHGWGVESRLSYKTDVLLRLIGAVWHSGDE